MDPSVKLVGVYAADKPGQPSLTFGNRVGTTIRKKLPDIDLTRPVSPNHYTTRTCQGISYIFGKQKS